MDISTIVLLGFALVVFSFTAICVVRFVECIRESKAESDAITRWWAERADYRTSSSIEDDSPEQTDTTGPRAA